MIAGRSLLTAVHGYLPGGEALGGEELKLARALQTREERRVRARPGRDGRHQAVHVDDAERLKLSGERGVADQYDARGLRLERHGLPRRSTTKWTVFSQGKCWRERETTYLRFLPRFCAQ